MQVTYVNKTKIIAIVLNTDDELNPCPFCGSTDVELTHTWTAAYWVECQDCGATRHGECPDHIDHYSEADHMQCAASAVVGWNRRA